MFDMMMSINNHAPENKCKKESEFSNDVCGERYNYPL